ncbi:acetyl-CoA synthetase-like protein [Patellaria atrata CBS 101060]|uniref:Acetyl-CoA synthetase-like protein n=1 Tax=Patellaria atrata CBS 101060 TaxID=1346257 RepID=A0A9P4S7F7_9PEZI|nr:acetyl-CoA synthetase-like protein [Patellaria atrata CBS 101060]
MTPKEPKSPIPTTIPTLLHARLLSAPSSPAILTPTLTLTTHQLWTISTHIRTRIPITPGTVVVLCMRRSWRLVACMLAVLRAGAAYVVLDPEEPAFRNMGVVAELGDRRGVVVGERDVGYLGKVWDVDCVVGVGGEVRWAGEVEEESGVRNGVENRVRNGVRNGMQNGVDNGVKDAAEPNDLAYLVFTSGSTGRPKGVMVTHTAACSGISYFSLAGKTRWLLFFNPGSSAAQRAVWGTLIHGGCLCIAGKEDVTASLARTICDMEIDGIGLTPSALSLMSPDEVRGLKMIIMVGERVDGKIVETWAGRVELWNFYGLSECTQMNFGKRLLPGGDPTCVGRPSDTVSVMIVDSDSKAIVSKGNVGEICLTGPQLSKGYWGRENETAERFVNNPFNEGQMLKTGDLGYEDEDGIHVVGRDDFQVKVDGQKVAPEEVSAQLANYPGIKACSVFGCQLGGWPALVAAIATDDFGSWDNTSQRVQSIRSFLTERIPSYMMPHYWLPRHSMPFGHNDKIDIQTLRKEAEQLGAEGLRKLIQGADTRFAGLSETEEVIRASWASVLGIPKESIGPQHSFSLLGGTSLQALRVIGKLRTEGILLELRDIFLTGNLSEAALRSRRIEDTADKGDVEVVPFSLIPEEPLRQGLQSQGGVEDAFPATPVQLMLLMASLRGHKGYVYQRKWDMTGINPQMLKEAFRTVFQESPTLRSVFIPGKAGFTQLVRTDLELPWEEDSSSTIEEFVKSDLEEQVVLGELMWRVTYVTKANVLVVTMHHSLFDFWSHRFLYQDVANAYFGFSHNPRPPFQRFVRWLQELESEESATFWEDYKKKVRPTLINTEKTEEYTHVFKPAPPALATSMTDIGLTIASVVYAAWAITMGKATAQDAVCFGTLFASRDIPVQDIARMDGPVFTLAAQAIELPGSKTVREIATSIYDGQWDLTAHSQWRLKQFVREGVQPPVFDTMVDILIADHGEEDVVAKRLFKRFGARPAWDTTFTALYLMEDDGEFSFAITSLLPESKVRQLLDTVIAVIHAILDVDDPAIRLEDLLSRLD